VILENFTDLILIFSLFLVLLTIILHFKFRVIGKEPVKREWKIILADTIPNHVSSTTLIKNYLTKRKSKMENLK